MRILVSNDDGIFSPGIKALGLAMRALGEVFVVAPDMEQSAVGHGITVRRPLRFKHTQSAGFGEIPAYRVDGTPADCVVLGVHLLGRPDLVVSGINLGVNLGLDLTHSGTVAAALEGASLGIPSIAFSLDTSGEVLDFQEAARWALAIARAVGERGLPPGVLLNVNFPASGPKASWSPAFPPTALRTRWWSGWTRRASPTTGSPAPQPGRRRRGRTSGRCGGGTSP